MAHRAPPQGQVRLVLHDLVSTSSSELRLWETSQVCLRCDRARGTHPPLHPSLDPQPAPWEPCAHLPPHHWEGARWMRGHTCLPDWGCPNPPANPAALQPWGYMFSAFFVELQILLLPCRLSPGQDTGTRTPHCCWPLLDCPAAPWLGAFPTSGDVCVSVPTPFLPTGTLAEPEATKSDPLSKKHQKARSRSQHGPDPAPSTAHGSFASRCCLCAPPNQNKCSNTPGYHATWLTPPAFT